MLYTRYFYLKIISQFYLIRRRRIGIIDLILVILFLCCIRLGLSRSRIFFVLLREIHSESAQSTVYVDLSPYQAKNNLYSSQVSYVSTYSR